jgi:agarase
LQSFRAETVRGAPGFFRVGQTRAGAWWLIDPQDRPFFACAINGVNAGDADAADSFERARGWGFNVLGVDADEAVAKDGAPHFGVVNFCATAGVIRVGGARLPDVFDPAWPERAAERAAAVCLGGEGRREMIGWLADDALGWARPAASGRPSLLQICLSLEPGFAAYHAAWEFVLAAHGGRIGELARAWSLPIPNKETIREMTRAEQALATRGYLRDNARWTREFAQRYFAITSAAIRACDSTHLVMGAREVRDGAEIASGAAAGGETELAVLSGGGFPAVDVPWVHWSEIAAAPIGPVFAGDFTWVTADVVNGGGGAGGRGLTSVERMLRRGRAALRRVVSHPTVVGYAWRQWRDRDGEQPPFAGGLVHANGVEAREHTELITDIHRRVGTLRAFES